MFTGIITDIGTLNKKSDHRLEIECHYEASSIDIGASIACDGCCLTVVERHETAPGQSEFAVEVSNETLNLTTICSWFTGQKINLERALKMGDEFGGHMVTGHIDGTATIKHIEETGSSHNVTLSVADELTRFIAKKGSVTLNGVSLTVNEAKRAEFGVTIIPHTLKATTWKDCKIGSVLNIEVDLLARYALRAAEIDGC